MQSENFTSSEQLCSGLSWDRWVALFDGGFTLFSSVPVPLVVGGLGLMAGLLAWCRSRDRQERMSHLAARQALKHSEETMQIALAASRSFTFSWEVATDAVVRSDSCGVVLGLAGDEARRDTGAQFFQRIVPGDRDRFVALLKRLGPDHAEYLVRYRVTRRDGSVVTLDEQGRGEFGKDGKLIKLNGVTTDVTDRARAEQALIASENLKRRILDALPSSIAVIDNRGKIIAVNQGWRDFATDNGAKAIAGLQEGANYCDECRRASAAGDPDAHTALHGIEAVMSGNGPTFQLEYPCHGPESQRWFEMKVVPLGDGEGAVIRHLDITEQKLIQKRLVASLREKEILLKEVHHRVKNNMQIISSLVGLKADTLDQPELHKAFGMVRDQIRAMALVHEKLYRSEDLTHVRFDSYIGSLLSHLWKVHGESIEAVHLKLDLEPVSLTVETALPCGLILNELVANCLRHAFVGRSSGDVEVSLRRDSDGKVVCVVADNGVGLPADRDWRSSESLGLKLVRMLVNQIGGDVDASADDSGTRFVFSFNPIAAPGVSSKT